MSIWYHYDVTCYARDRAAVAKFFNLQPTREEVRTDMFEFSFGAKNGPGLHLGKLIDDNPDLIFLVKSSIEVDFNSWWICRNDVEAGAYQQISLCKIDLGREQTLLNKKIMEEYTKKYPTLANKPLRDFRWSMFFNDFEQSAIKLKNAEDYSEMITIASASVDIQEIEYENDFSHMVGYD